MFGGAVIYNCSWRWIFYIQLLIYGVLFVPLLFVMKETRISVIRARRTKASANESLSPARFLYNTVVLPAYLLSTEPVIFFFTLLSALSYGVVFMSTQSVTQVFMENYDFLEYQTGLVQASAVIGEALGFAACLVQKMPVTPAQQNPTLSYRKQTSLRFGCMQASRRVS